MSVGAGDVELSLSLLHWINDGLMAVFFFVVGLEIKREILAGELSSLAKALLPIAAAVGGMLVPALIYLAFTWGGRSGAGLGHPHGHRHRLHPGRAVPAGAAHPREPQGLSHQPWPLPTTSARCWSSRSFTARRSMSRSWSWAWPSWRPWPGPTRWACARTLTYALMGTAAWLCFYNSGIHATVAGVLAAMTIPARPRVGVHELLESSRRLLDELKQEHQGRGMLASDRFAQDRADPARLLPRRRNAPVQRLDALLHPWVAFRHHAAVRPGQRRSAALGGAAGGA